MKMETKKVLETFGKEERTVTLTNNEWLWLTTYIRITTSHRMHEAEEWEELSAEKKDDGTPRFKNAKGNAEFWWKMDAILKQISQKIHTLEEAVSLLEESKG